MSVISRLPAWTASWIGTFLILGQIVLLFVLGAGGVAFLRYAGFALWALAAVFGWVPILQFKRSGGVARGESYVRTTRLVDSGLYAIVRHPQFVAWPLMAVAVALISQHPAVIVMGVVASAVACIDFPAVERMDVAKFGEDYRAYMQRVPGWNFVAGLWRWARRRRHRRRACGSPPCGH